MKTVGKAKFTYCKETEIGELEKKMEKLRIEGKSGCSSLFFGFFVHGRMRVCVFRRLRADTGERRSFFLFFLLSA